MNSRSSGQPKNDAKTLFSTLHPLSMVIFATATVLAFVLLRNSRFNFHFYTQREAMPTQKSARKCAATSGDFLCKRLQSAFTLANQLRLIAQYIKTKGLFMKINQSHVTIVGVAKQSKQGVLWWNYCCCF